jgi:hypothetical protein
MSAGPETSTPPTAADLEQRFPLSAVEAQAIADAMTPLQNLTGVGGSFGNAMEDLPGPGPKLAGTVLRTVSTQVNLASQSAEVVARAIDFYVTAQGGAVEDLFPPPQEMVTQLERDVEAFSDILAPPQE